MSNTLVPQVGLGALIFNKHDQLLLGKRKGAHGKSTWAPPGGHLEFGEALEAGIAREVMEETGLAVDSVEFVGITNDFFETEKKHYISIFMKVISSEGQEVKNLEPHKTEEWKWFHLKNLPEPLFLPLHKLLAGEGFQAKLV